MPIMIHADDVAFGYGRKFTIEDISFDVGESEIVGILGPNGSGKTTLIKCINRIHEPRQGRILLFDKDISAMSRRDIASEIGYVPQSNTSAMSMPSVFDVVMMGRAPHNMWNQPSSDEEIVWDILDKLDLTQLANNGFDELSSGQTQRVLIARALVQEAKVLLLDEPTSNLDVSYQLDVMDMIRNIVDTKGISACTIVHDINLALRYCDRVVLMKEGRVVGFGKTADILTAENIKDVFGVDVELIERNGRLNMLLL